jgi:fermentation-respiration switch protein FrsA (DUF1100 family)
MKLYAQPFSGWYFQVFDVGGHLTSEEIFGSQHLQNDHTNNELEAIYNSSKRTNELSVSIGVGQFLPRTTFYPC